MTLAEVVIAVALLVTTMAGLAPILASCVRMLADARAESRALVAASARLEQLGSLRLEQEASTLALVTDRTANLSTAPVDATGTGLLPLDPALAWTPTPGYVDYLDDVGASQPSGDAGATTITRRWAVSELPAPPGSERLLVHVFARATARERVEPPRESADRRPSDVWLFSIRTRVRR